MNGLLIKASVWRGRRGDEGEVVFAHVSPPRLSFCLACPFHCPKPFYSSFTYLNFLGYFVIIYYLIFYSFAKSEVLNL